MRLASKGGIGWREKQLFRWFRLRKRIHQFLKFRPGGEKTILFIVGCQRSGTSMIHHQFRLDFDTVTFDEISPLSSRDTAEGLRLNPLPEVAALFASVRAPFVLAKPLVESQNLTALLDAFPDSRALWMFRHYRDVVRSNLRYFGRENGLKDLLPIVEGDETNWRAENLGAEDRDTIRRLYSPDMDPYDAAALFWYARNSLFFSRGYPADSRIRTCRYEDLVTNPAKVMAGIYGFVGRPYPGDRVVAGVFPDSKGKGRDVDLSPPVREVCEDLMRRLEAEPGFGVTSPAG